MEIQVSKKIVSQDNEVNCCLCNNPHNHFLSIRIDQPTKGSVVVMPDQTITNIKSAKMDHGGSQIEITYFCEICWHVWSKLEYFHEGNTSYETYDHGKSSWDKIKELERSW